MATERPPQARGLLELPSSGSQGSVQPERLLLSAYGPCGARQWLIEKLHPDTSVSAVRPLSKMSVPSVRHWRTDVNEIASF